MRHLRYTTAHNHVCISIFRRGLANCQLRDGPLTSVPPPH